MFSSSDLMFLGEGNNNLSPGGLDKIKRSNSIGGNVSPPTVKLSTSPFDVRAATSASRKESASELINETDGLAKLRENSSSPTFLAVPTVPRARKFSLPNVLSAPLVSLGESAPSDAFLGASRRRLSQVSLAVSQHLQSTIGWKPTANQEQISEQAKCLCAKYLHFKLRKCGLMHKKLRFQRLRSVSNLSDIDPEVNLNRIALELKYIIQELERASPKLYQSVTNHIGNASAIFASTNSLQKVHQLLGREIFRDEISWAKIASYYATTGALAVDCARSGHPDYVLTLVDSLAAFVDQDLCLWISQQGGWVNNCASPSHSNFLLNTFCTVMG